MLSLVGLLCGKASFPGSQPSPCLFIGLAWACSASAVDHLPQRQHFFGGFLVSFHLHTFPQCVLDFVLSGVMNCPLD